MSEWKDVMIHLRRHGTVEADTDMAQPAASTAMQVRRAKAVIEPRILTASNPCTLDSSCYGFCYVALCNLYPLGNFARSFPDPAVKNEPDYTTLKRRIQDAGLLEKKPAYYVLSITTNLVVWTLFLVLIFTVGAIWAQALARSLSASSRFSLASSFTTRATARCLRRPGKNAFVGLFTANLLLA